MLAFNYLSFEEEQALRNAIEVKCPERLPEFELAWIPGIRLSEQYGLRSGHYLPFH